MKVIVFNATQVQKEHLAWANLKKHKITVIASPLDIGNVRFCVAKEAVMMMNWQKNLSTELLEKLALYRIKLLLTTSPNPPATDPVSVVNPGFEYHMIHSADSRALAWQIIRLLDSWQKSDENHF